MTHILWIDNARKMIAVELSGFVSAETVEALFEEEQRAVERLGCKGKAHLLLVDATRLVPVAKDVAQDITRQIADRRYSSRKCAIVMTSALARLQMKRIVQDDEVGYFETLEGGEAWLAPTSS